MFRFPDVAQTKCIAFNNAKRDIQDRPDNSLVNIGNHQVVYVIKLILMVNLIFSLRYLTFLIQDSI